MKIKTVVPQIGLMDIFLSRNSHPLQYFLRVDAFQTQFILLQLTKRFIFLYNFMQRKNFFFLFLLIKTSNRLLWGVFLSFSFIHSCYICHIYVFGIFLSIICIWTFACFLCVSSFHLYYIWLDLSHRPRNVSYRCVIGYPICSRWLFMNKREDSVIRKRSHLTR